MKPWKKLSSRLLIEDRWLTVRADRCELPQGAVIEPYYVIEERDWVHAVVFDEQRRVAVVRQYRHAGATFTLEFPGGVADPQEEPLATARREFREETGYEAENWRHGATLFANPARTTNRVHLYFADGARLAGAQELDEAEHAEVSFLTLDDLLAEVAGGAFSNSTHAGLLLFALKEAGRITA